MAIVWCSPVHAVTLAFVARVPCALCSATCSVLPIVALPMLPWSISLISTCSDQLCFLQGSALSLGRVQATGAQFPLVARFWEGDTAFRCMGAGVRSKKFGFIGVKVRHLMTECHHLASAVTPPAVDGPEGLEDMWQLQWAWELAEQSASLMLKLSHLAAQPAH